MRRNPAKTILIVADDLGFVLWAGQALANAKYTPLAAKNVAEARQLMEETPFEIGVFIIDPSLAGATKWLKMLRAQPRPVKVFALGNPPAETAELSGADGVVLQPSDPDSPRAAATWVKTLERCLLRHSAA
jgi:DNA-binding NtrC family response regulator